MNKLLLLLLSFGWLPNLSASEMYAVFPRTDNSVNMAVTTCQKNNISIVTVMHNPECVIVEVEEQKSLSLLGFYSKVRVFDQKLCFNTNVLLVKMKKEVKSIIQQYHLKKHRFIPNLYSFHFEGNSEKDLLLMKETLENEKGVGYVSFNQVFTINATVNDPLYNRQWSIENIGTSMQFNGTVGADMSVDSAWTITTGDSTIKIAVLDSGVDTLHEDLQGNLLFGFDAFATTGAGTQGFPSLNFSEDGHGTSTAGIVGARGNNGLGTAGVAYNCKIIPVRIFYYQDYGGSIGVQATTSSSTLIDGTAYAWRIANADIISTSAGLSQLSISLLQIDTVLLNSELNDAYANARNGKGVALFFSSGNDDIDGVLWPASEPNTIAIGASTMCDERKTPSDCSPENWWGSNYGNTLDVIAPGVKITTTDITGADGFAAGNYTYSFNGTSAACPNAAAVGALILSVNDTLSAEDVRAIINITADKVPNYTYSSTLNYGTWNTEVGYGRVNAYEAVKLAQNYYVGINEFANDETVTIYPNPTKGNVTVLFGKNNDNWDIKVTDIQGKLIFTKTVTGSNSIQIDFEGEAGIYLFTIKNKAYSKVVKIVKK